MLNKVRIKGFTLPNFFKKNLRGFTLTEILVTIAIIVILSGLIIANSGTGQSQLALSRSANKLAQDIRRAQEMAMSAKECDECGGVVPKRYGIYMTKDSNEYILFADYPGDSDGKFYWPPFDSTKDTKIETIYYESGIRMDDAVGIDCSPSGPKRYHISFAPPNPTIEIWIGKWGPGVGTDAVQCSGIILTLRAGTAGPTRSVRINQAGLISVE
jgi:prepilin-type N-terminal cleavage/methylation domain-containing protein